MRKLALAAVLSTMYLVPSAHAGLRTDPLEAPRHVIETVICANDVCERKWCRWRWRDAEPSKCWRRPWWNSRGARSIPR